MDSAAESSPLLPGEKNSLKNSVEIREESSKLRCRPRRQRRWKSRPRVIGAVMFAMALAGLVAIFNAMRGAQAPAPSSSNIQEITAAMSLSSRPRAEGVEGPATGRKAAEPSGNTEVFQATGTVATPAHEPHLRITPKENDARASSTSDKPNVFFIMVDDMGWNDIGYQSTDMANITPNLDRLAAGGVKLKNYYTMSICTPARASLMTGRYVIRYGLQYNVIQPGAPWGMPLTEKLMPQYMKDAGYETHMVGKWHIGSYTFDHIPNNRGFDTYLGYLNDEEMYWTHQSWTAKLYGRKFFDFGYGNATDYYDIISRKFAATPAWPNNDGDDSTGPTSTLSSSDSLSMKGLYSTTLFQNRATEVIKNKSPHDEHPLFLYLAHQAVHDPLGVPPVDDFSAEDWALLDDVEENSDSALRLRFAKVLMYLDKTVGDLVSLLEEEGWMENSIIVVASDNGGCPSKGGSNYPLRGIKHTYWEGGNKVPAFVYSPSHLPEEIWGSEYSGLMHVTDWLPTLASAAKIELNGSAGALDGIDHWEYLTDRELLSSGESPRTEMLYNFDPYIMWADDDAIDVPDYPLAQGAFRQGKWKFTFNEWCSGWYTFDSNIEQQDPLTNSSNTCTELGECSDCGKSCLGYANTTNWLFDLEMDPREEHNVVDLFPDVADSMRRRVHEIVFKEYMNSSYSDVSKTAYYVWAKHNWWMVPWYEYAREGSDELGILNCGNSSTSSVECSSPSTSWTSLVSSSSSES
ncbi:unnamed protein product [Ascophyllum nodosum]